MSYGASADQRRIDDSKEQARLARVERLLGGGLRRKIKRASELQFNYQSATVIAKKEK